MQQRVNVYVDAFNFFHGLKKMRKSDPDWQSFYWLDLVKFFDHFMLPGQTLQKVYYFTAPDHDPLKRVRQDVLLRANRLVNGERFEIVNGIYYDKSVKCKLCNGRYTIQEEKRTDVNIAAYMMRDCALGNMNAMMLVTADSDLVTPIELINVHYPDISLRLCFPPSNQSRDLTNVMKARRKEPLLLIKHKQKFINSVLPDVVSKDGTNLTIPAKWKQPYTPPVPSNVVPMSLLDLYAKHFGVAQSIEFDHPNMTAFIAELNELSSKQSG